MRRYFWLLFVIGSIVAVHCYSDKFYEPSVEELYLHVLQAHQVTWNRTQDFNLASQEESFTWYTAQEVFDIIETLSSSERTKILEACPDVSGEVSPECLTSLNSIFMKYPIVLHWESNEKVDFLHFIQKLTYADILQDPQQDLDNVREVLARPECRDEQSDWYKPNLSEECHADSFRRVHFMLLSCDILTFVDEGLLNWRFPYRQSKEMDHNRLFRSTFTDVQRLKDFNLEDRESDNFKYSITNSQRDFLWDVLLQKKWILHQCAGLDRSQIEPVIKEGHNPTTYLLETSARLGDSESTLLGLLKGDREFNDFITSRYQWLAPYEKSPPTLDWHEYESMNDLFEYTYDEYTAQLMYFIDAMHQADQHGWDYDLSSFVSDFCEPFFVRLPMSVTLHRQVSWPGDCSWLVYRIREGNLITDTAKQQLLYKFAEAAKRQSVYRLNEVPEANKVFSPVDVQRDRDYELIVDCEPPRPSGSRNEGLEGSVTLEFTVTETGATTNINVVESELPIEFETYAIDALSMYRYLPQVTEGRVVKVEGVREVVWFSSSD